MPYCVASIPGGGSLSVYRNRVEEEIFGATLPEHLVALAPGVTVGGMRVDYLLGQDWIEAVGGIHITFRRSTLRLTVSFPDLEGVYLDEPMSQDVKEVVGSLIPTSDLSEGDTKPLVIVTDEDEREVEEVSVPAVTVGEPKRAPLRPEAEVLKPYPQGTRVGAVIEQEDFVVRQLIFPDSSSRWELEWVWLHGPPDPKRLPPMLNGHKLSDIDWEHVRSKVKDLIDKKYLVAVSKNKVKLNLPIIAVLQYHKLSTPVRLVGNFKFLNAFIKSFPRRGVLFPIHLTNQIRVWRSIKVELKELAVLDIREAYFQILVAPFLVGYQGFIIPWEEAVTFVLTRMGFGLSIAPKVLNLVLYHILQEKDLWKQIKLYVDDLILRRRVIDLVRKVLRKHGFETKPPVPLLNSKVLGLFVMENGNWKRRDQLPPIVATGPSGRPTYRNILSWKGKFVAHYPVAGWARCALHCLVRLASKACKQDTEGAHKAKFDEEIPEDMHELCVKFDAEIKAKEDPVGGVWKYDETKEWKVYVDASNYAYGWVLEIGGVVVEDGTKLRKEGDNRQINQAELDALLVGLEVAHSFKKAHEMTGKVAVTLLSDSRSAVCWASGPGTADKGVKSRDAQLINEKRRVFFAKALEYGLETTVAWVDGDLNLADSLSRAPVYFLPFLKRYCPTGYRPDQMEVAAAIVIRAPREYDLLGRPVLHEDEARAYLKAVHRHEGADSLYRLAKQFISVKNLFALCEELRASCEECQVGQRTPSYLGLGPAAGSSGCARGHPDVPRGTFPWERCYVDIKGPLFTDDFGSRVYVTALKDGASGLVIAKYTYDPPSFQELVAVAQEVRLKYFAHPGVLHFDHGSQMMHAEFTRYLQSLGVAIVRTPVDASWYNGQVESFFKVLQDRLCSAFCLQESFSESEFIHVLQEVVLNYNCTPQEGREVSPMRFLFNYEPTCIGPADMRHKKNQALFSQDVFAPKHPIEAPEELIAWNRSDGRKLSRLPKVGESWLVLADSAKKMQPRYIWCTVIRRISRARYVILDETGRAQIKAVKHLKRVSQEVFRNTAEEKQAVVDYLEAIGGNIDSRLSRRGRRSRAAQQLSKTIRKTTPTRPHSVPVRDTTRPIA